MAPPNSYIDDMRAWVLKMGGTLHDSVEIVHSAECGYHVRVKTGKTLAAGSEVVRCPYVVTLSYSDVERDERFVPQRWLSLGDARTVGAFFLCFQYLSGEKSTWWEYIRSLPQPDEEEKLASPLYFSDEDLKWLKGTKLEKSVTARKAEWLQNFETGVARLKKMGWMELQYTWSLLRWAASIYSSRGFPSKLLFANKTMQRSAIAPAEEFPVLFPLADILNHSNDAKMTWKADSDHLVFVSHDSIASGQQVMNNYGPKANDELLLGYGFTIVNNVFDFREINFTFPLSPIKKKMFDKLMKQDSLNKGGKDVENYLLRRPESPLSYAYNTSHAEWKGLPPALICIVSIGVANPYETILLSRGYLSGPTQRPQASRHFSHLVQEISLLLTYTNHDLQQTTMALGEPENLRQKHAKIYRESQVEVVSKSKQLIEARYIESLMTSIETPLPDMLDLETASSILSSVGYNLHMTFDCVIDDHLHILSRYESFDLAKVIDSGWEDLLWCIWICLLYLEFNRATLDKSPHASRNNAEIRAHLKKWIDLMTERYKICLESKKVNEDSFTFQSGTESYSKEPLTLDAPPDDMIDEVLSIGSALCSTKEPTWDVDSSHFRNESSWTRELVTWALVVMRAEGFSDGIGYQVRPQGRWVMCTNIEEVKERPFWIIE